MQRLKGCALFHIYRGGFMDREGGFRDRGGGFRDRRGGF
jgi:hypothetical protein